MVATTHESPDPCMLTLTVGVKVVNDGFELSVRSISPMQVPTHALVWKSAAPAGWAGTNNIPSAIAVTRAASHFLIVRSSPGAPVGPGASPIRRALQPTRLGRR